MPRKKTVVTTINTKLDVVATCTVARLGDGRLALLGEAKSGEEWGQLRELLDLGERYDDLGHAVAAALDDAIPKPRKRKKKAAAGEVLP